MLSVLLCKTVDGSVEGKGRMHGKEKKAISVSGWDPIQWSVGSLKQAWGPAWLPTSWSPKHGIWKCSLNHGFINEVTGTTLDPSGGKFRLELKAVY